MKKQKSKIKQKEWDFLFILDACRYDYFKKKHKEFFSGNLDKVKSESYHTEKWRKKTFDKKYDDVVYISANPYINSRVEIKGFKASDYFHKVIDVWLNGWNEELGTVHPRKVNESVFVQKNRYPDKKFIIHYLQPHAPYLSKGKLGGGDPFIDVKRNLDQSKNLKNLWTGLRDKVGPKIVRYTGWETIWKLRELIGLDPINPEEAAYRKLGKKGLREAYEDNLMIVLNSVKELCKELEGDKIITADHGELLGENGNYLHHDPHHPLLFEVPWFKIEKTKN